MNAFLTGSRVYGTPRPESDTDLMVLLSSAEVELLAASQIPSAKPNSGNGSNWGSFRFGNLNVIATCDPALFEVWRRCTDELLERKPVTRAQAVEHFKKLEGEYHARKETA